MKNNIQAAIIDLDGVITRTASKHARAWKKMFDQYNEKRKKEGKTTYRDFSIQKDYPNYIDGIPRYDGVTQFLKSRNIDLPYGTPDDEPDKETVCGLGNWKNTMFLEIIKEEGVQVFEKNIEKIKDWKTNGIKVAVISSSKNCKHILEAAGLEHLFEVRVDGVISQEQGIKGKPAPDIFLEAARELNVKPEHALVVEDALAGVEAGKKGNFGLVVGVPTSAGKQELLKKGADIVVESLDQLNFEKNTRKHPTQLPSALKKFPELKEKMQKSKPLFFLDFDGTLTPIVERYEDAELSEEMRTILKNLSYKYPTAVVSGRDVRDVQKRVGLENVYYAGSHGFEISGPNNFHKEKEEAEDVLPVLDELEQVLKEKLKTIEGARLERKKYAIAVHYRQVSDELEKEVIDRVDEVLTHHNKVKKGEGKKVIEVRPNIDWDKGKALMFLKELLPADDKHLPVYIGDDITDEDAFKTLQNGLGILVGDHGQKTCADYYLENVDEVKDFFKQLLY